MAINWTQPKTWLLTDVYNASEMNIQLRDNLEYLYERPLSYARISSGSAVDLYPSLSSWQPLVAYDLTIETESGRLEYNFWITYLASTAAARIVNFDVLFVEASIWLSSGTTTQATDGAAYARVPSNTSSGEALLRGIVELPAGTYTCRVYIKSSAVGVNTIPNMVYQPSVKEV